MRKISKKTCVFKYANDCILFIKNERRKTMLAPLLIR